MLSVQMLTTIAPMHEETCQLASVYIYIDQNNVLMLILFHGLYVNIMILNNLIWITK